MCKYNFNKLLNRELKHLSTYSKKERIENISSGERTYFR